MSKEDKARVRVFFGEIEGDNETVRDALKSIASAVTKTFQIETPTVRILAVGSEGKALPLSQETEQEIVDAAFGDDVTPEEQFATNGKVPQNKSKSTRKPVLYQFVKELNLRPGDRKSLKEFYAEKKPADQQEQLIVILYYLSRILEINTVTANHLYSAYKELEVRVPMDIAQSLRRVSNKKGWVDSSDSSSFKTLVKGDNFVEQDLPQNKG